MLFNRAHLKSGVRSLYFCLALLFDFLIFTLEVFVKRPKASILIGIASPSSVGGTELQINKIAEYLGTTNLKPLILTIGPIENLYGHQFLKRLKMGNIAYLQMGRIGQVKNKRLQTYVALLIKRFRASLYHCFNPLSANLVPAAKKANLKILYSETGLPKKDLWWMPLEPHIPAIDFAIAISNTSLSNLRSYLHYQGPAAVLYSLIDPPPSILPSRLQKSKEFRILYFGRMHVNKGIFLLLDAFRTLLVEYPSAHLTFVGEGSDKKNLQQRAREGEIANRVHFLDYWNRQELYGKIGQFNLFCLPSFSEGTPCSILEAMSIGLPIVASRIGGIPEIIEDGKSGLLVPPNDKIALAKALSFLAKDPEARTQMGVEAFKRYHGYFSSLNTLSQLTSIYEKILA